MLGCTQAKNWAETPESKRIDLTQHLHLSLTLIRDWKRMYIVPIIITTRGANYDAHKEGEQQFIVDGKGVDQPLVIASYYSKLF